MKFRLQGGDFVQDGKVYIVGDVVSSESNLAKIFRNKFKRISNDIPATEREVTATIPIPEANLL